MKHRILRILLFIVVPLLLIVGVLAALTYKQVRQDRLNQELIAAIKKQDYPVALQALREGADAQARDLPPDQRPFWKRLLARLSASPSPQASDTSAALELIGSDIGLDAIKPRKDLESQKASDVAASAVVRTLLQRGANPNEHDQKTYLPPFFYIIQNGTADEVKAFLEYGVHFDIHSQEARDALFDSLGNFHPSVTAVLLDRGMNPNATDEHGSPLLVDAAYHGNTEVVRLLLDRGVSIQTKDENGTNALEWAESHRYMILGKGATEQDEAVKSLESVIAFLKSRGAKRQTP